MTTEFGLRIIGTENSAFDILLAVKISGLDTPETTKEVFFDGHSPFPIKNS